MEGLNWLSLKPINYSTTDEEDDRNVIVEVRFECNTRRKRSGPSKPFFNRPIFRGNYHDDHGGRSRRTEAKQNMTCRSLRSEEEAKCPVCSRSFGSMKAMHGHMRCHPERGWRGAKCPVLPQPPPPSSPEKSASSSSNSLSHGSTTTSIDTTLPPKKRLYEAEGVALPTSKHAMKAHQCRTCGKSFHTGQALGGHQTTHRPKPPQTARHNANPRVLDFDLNQLPPMQEE